MQPKRLEINIGWGCNNNCLFCTEKTSRINASKNKMLSKDMAVLAEDLLKARKNGAEHLTLLGGEPTIHQEFLSIISLAKGMGYKEIFVTTNGRMFEDIELLKKAKAAGMSELCFSIHGSNPEIHQSLTMAKGSFKQAVQALENALKIGIPVMTNTVINKKNYKDLPALAKMLSRLDITQSTFSFIQPYGDENYPYNKLIPKISDIMPYVLETIKVYESNNKKIRINSIPMCILKEYYIYSDDLCFSDRKIINHFQEEILQTEKKGKDKVKKESCKKCKHFNDCEGVWQGYDKIYGFAEFEPVK
jgi:MoaA/NifB/PqqE/SkfB family radical SAM enzyme